MDKAQIANLLEIPLASMNGQQAYQLLQYVTENKSELTGEHLELALRHRLFKKAVQIMNLGITCPTLVSLVSSILSSPVALETDFHIFALFCVASGVDFSCILDNLANTSEANISAAMIILIPLLLLTEDVSGIDVSSAPYLIRTVVEGVKQKSSECMIYIYLKHYITSVAQKVYEQRLTGLENIKEIVRSKEIMQRIKELSNAVISTTKNLTTAWTIRNLETARNNIKIKCTDLESHMKTSLVKAMTELNTAVAQIKAIYEDIKRIMNNADFTKKEMAAFIENESSERATEMITRLKNLCVDYANEKVISGDLDTRLYSIQFLSYFIGSLRLYTNGKTTESTTAISAFTDHLNNFSDRIQQDVPQYQAVLVDPMDLTTEINDPNSDIFKAGRYACDSLLFTMYYCECAYLESIAKEEAIGYSQESSFYPKAHSEIFKKTIRGPMLSQATGLRKARGELLQTMTETVSKFMRNMRAIPGVRKDTTYTDFAPAECWPWPKIAGYDFPKTPQEVRDVIVSRSNIQGLLEEYIISQSAETCQKCHTALAVVVCPDCKRIVSCNKCLKDNEGACPLCNKSLK